MSDLDNAINSINASAAKAENTATFLDDMSTFDDQSSVTNPNNGQTVASIPKQVKDRTDELFTAAESDINQAVSDAAQSATDAQDAADSIGRYQGLWPDTGGSALKGETWQTQVGGTPTGNYYTALQNTSVNPVGDNVNWKVAGSIGQQNISDYTDIVYKAVSDMLTDENLQKLKDGSIVETLKYHVPVISKWLKFSSDPGNGFVLSGVNCFFQLVIVGKSARLEEFGCKPNDPSFNNEPYWDLAMTHLDTVNMSGDYYGNNLKIPNKTITFKSIGDFRSTFRAITGSGDPDYFAAPLEWINSTTLASSPIKTINVGFDGGDRDNGLVVHWFFGDHDDFYATGGLSRSVLITAINRDLSTITSSMVNNKFRNIWIEGSADIGLEVEEDGKSTDYHIEGGYILNNGSLNIKARTLAGALITGIHCYGSTESALFSKWSTGTRVVDNYFEKDVVISGGLDNTTPFNFGPTNSVNGNLSLALGGVCGVVKSQGNQLTTVSHNYFGDKLFVSEGDTYRDSSPFSFFNTSPTNEAKIDVKNALVNGGLKSGQLSPETGRNTEASLVGAFTDKPLISRKAISTSSGVLSQTITVPSLNADGSYTVRFVAASRLNHTSTIAIASTRTWSVTRKALDNVFGKTLILEFDSGGTWVSQPSINLNDNGDGTMSVTIDAEYASVGFAVGQVSIEIT